MRLLRSWPDRIPEGRTGYVVDGLERILISGHDYRHLAAIRDDVLLLEWDIAVGQEELQLFADTARQAPDDVLVAPYRIYADTYGLPANIWAHRRWDGTGLGTVVPVGAVPVDTDAPVCNLFGLGMVYLPRELVRAHVAECWSARFGDVEFSMWHYQRVRPEVPILWDVQPVHLNYLVETLNV